MSKTWTMSLTVTENPETTQGAMSNEERAARENRPDPSTLIKTLGEQLRASGFSVTGTYRLDQGDDVPV